MEKKLPGIYANKIEKKLENNSKVSVTKPKEIIEIKTPTNNGINKTINQKLKEVFNSPKYVYKIEAKIKLKDGEITKKLIGYNQSDLITIDNELIPIKDILDIEID